MHGQEEDDDDDDDDSTNTVQRWPDIHMLDGNISSIVLLWHISSSDKDGDYAFDKLRLLQWSVNSCSILRTVQEYMLAQLFFVVVCLCVYVRRRDRVAV